MRAAKIALWSIVSLITLLVLTVVWLWTADLGVLKPHLENWVSDMTGREFAIDGSFNVDLAGTSVVVANGIRFQNADWADDPQMIEVGRLEIHLDLWSLFNGPILIDFVDVDDAVIRLIKPDGREANWVLPAIPPSEPADPAAGIGVLVKILDIDQVNVIYDSNLRDRVLDLRIESLDQEYRDDEFLDFGLRASLNDRRIELDGEAGTLNALLAGSDIRFKVTGKLDTFSFESSGWIDDVTKPRRPEFSFSASSPNIDDLTRLLGIGEDSEGDINLRGSLQAVDGSDLALSVIGNIAQTKIEAAGRFSDLQDLEHAEIDLLASGPDLSRILRLVGVHALREAPFMIDINAQRHGPLLVVEQGRMVFAGAEFDVSGRLPSFPSADGAKAKVLIRGPDIEGFRYVTRLPGKSTGPFSLGLEIDGVADGNERFNLDLTTSFGTLSARGELSGTADYYGSTVDLELRGDSLQRLGDAYGVANLPDAFFRVTGGAELTADGIRLSDKLTVSVIDIVVAVGGRIALADGGVGSELSVALNGPSLAGLTGIFGVTDYVPERAFDVSGELLVRDDGYHLRRASGTLGSASLGVRNAFLPKAGLSGSSLRFSIAGPAIEELVDAIGDFEVRPGEFELAGELGLRDDAIAIKGLELNRPAGELSLDMELGLPVSRRWVNFDVKIDASNMRSVFRRLRRYEAEPKPFFVDVRGELRGSDLSVDKFEMGVGAGRLRAKGDIGLTPQGSSTRFTFSGDIPSLAEFGSFDGRRFRDQAIRWDTRVEGSDGVLKIDNLNLTLGESDVHGSVHFVSGEVPSLDIDIRAGAIVFGPLREDAEPIHDPAPVFKDGRLIPDFAIPFDALRKLDASVDVEVGAVTRDELHIRNVELRAELQGGTLDVPHVSFDGFNGWLKGRANVSPAGGSGSLALELVARDFTGIDRGPGHTMRGDADIRLDSRGLDARTLAGNARGMLLLNFRGGRMANSQALQAIYGDMLTEIVNVINPFYKASPYTDIECMVMAVSIDDGRLAGAPGSFFGTDKIRVALASQINLKTEKIDISAKMRPKKGLKISSGELLNPYVKIVGTLAAPRLAVDEAGVLLSGGTAVATGGLSILASMAWDRLSRAKDPCAEAAAEGRAALHGRMPTIGDQPAESSTYSRTD